MIYTLSQMELEIIRDCMILAMDTDAWSYNPKEINITADTLYSKLETWLESV